MREIKFRAWDKEDNKMIEVLRMTFYPNIGWNCCANCGLHIGVYPSRYELMQYTGLKDKNGKEIYEGDILQSNGGRIRQVIHDEYTGGYKFNTGADIGHCTFFEVIGNIWENPKLLGG